MQQDRHRAAAAAAAAAAEAGQHAGAKCLGDTMMHVYRGGRGKEANILALGHVPRAGNCRRPRAMVRPVRAS